MLNSITTYFGELKDLTDLLSSDLTTRPGNYLTYTQEKNGYTQKDLNYLYLYKNDRSLYGMKQKVGIVAAFMHDPQILILDEPTSGLDPLMQNRFIELVEAEREKGKTILRYF